jgi:hypothetical protein
VLQVAQGVATRGPRYPEITGDEKAIRDARFGVAREVCVAGQ